MMEIWSLLNLNFLFVTYVAIIYIEYKYKSTFIFFWLFLAIVFFIPHFIETTTYYKSDFSIEVLNKTTIFALLFNLLYFFMRSLLFLNFNKPLVNINFHAAESTAYNTMDKIFYFGLLSLFIMSCFLIIYIFIRGGSVLESTWAYKREISDIKMIIGISVLNSCGAFILMSYVKKKKMILISSLVLFLVILLLLRSRSLLLPVVMPFAYYYLFSKKINYRSLSVFLLSGLLAFSSAYLFQSIRWLGALSNILSINIVDSVQLLSLTLENILTRGELFLRRGFYEFVANDNAYTNFEQGKTYIRLILLPFPTGLMEGLKPQDFAYDMWNALFFEKGGTFHPTIYGDCFANFGMVGTFLGLFYAGVAYIVDSIQRKARLWTQVAILAPYLFFVVLLARGAVYNSFAQLFRGIIILFVLYGLCTIFKKIVNKRIKLMIS